MLDFYGRIGSRPLEEQQAPAHLQQRLLEYRGSGSQVLIIKRDKRVRPEDGVLIRCWIRSSYDLVQQLEYTEDHYEVIRDRIIIDVEDVVRSPATRWYTQTQVLHLYQQASFTNIQMVQGFSQEPTSESDTFFTIQGTRA